MTVYACIEDFSWCDVSYAEYRGWVAADYIRPFYQSRFMTVGEYAPLVALPHSSLRRQAVLDLILPRSAVLRGARSIGPRLASRTVVPDEVHSTRRSLPMATG